MRIALFAAIGAALGLAYVAALAWNARLYVSSTGAGKAVLLHIARSIGLPLALVALATAGAGPLMAAVGGFACAHAVLVSGAWRRA